MLMCFSLPEVMNMMTQCWQALCNNLQTFQLRKNTTFVFMFNTEIKSITTTLCIAQSFTLQWYMAVVLGSPDLIKARKLLAKGLLPWLFKIKWHIPAIFIYNCHLMDLLEWVFTWALCHYIAAVSKSEDAYAIAAHIYYLTPPVVSLLPTSFQLITTGFTL